MDDWVFVDTCVWASFFTKPNSVEKRNVDELIDAEALHPSTGSTHQAQIRWWLHHI